MVEHAYLHSEITDKVIKAFYKIYNKLGYGFLEKVYEKSMMIELKKIGLNAQRQVPIKVYYDGEVVGDYEADIIVEEMVIVELKASESLNFRHEAQLLNYLKATELEVGLLLNFGANPQLKRKIFMNERKPELGE